MRYLQNIHGHDDLVKLNDRERAELCDEIRDFLVQNISKTGGHLASNLGVVELMVAIETVFQTQKDQRRGTSGLSITTFRIFMMLPQLKNNQKREGLFIKGD